MGGFQLSEDVWGSNKICGRLVLDEGVEDNDLNLGISYAECVSLVKDDKWLF